MKAIFWIGPCGIFGAMIRVFKRRGISHSEIMFSDGVCGTADFKVGVTLRKLEIRHSDWVMIDIPASPEVEALVRQVFIAEAGCKYDWSGIISAQIFGWAYQTKSRWFCSEICAAALVPAVPSLIRFRAASLDPAKLANLILDDLAARPTAQP